MSETLLKNTNLTEIDLEYNEIGEPGIKALSDSLIKNDSLKIFNLGIFLHHILYFIRKK